MNAIDICKNVLNKPKRELNMNEGKAPPLMLSCIKRNEFIFQSY